MEVNTEIIPQIQNKLSGGNIASVYRKFANVVSLITLIAVGVCTSIIGFTSIGHNKIPKVDKKDKDGNVVKDENGKAKKIDNPLLMGTIITVIVLAVILTMDIWVVALKSAFNVLKAPARLVGFGLSVFSVVGLIIVRQWFIENEELDDEDEKDISWWWWVLGFGGVVGTIVACVTAYVFKDTIMVG